MKQAAELVNVLKNILGNPDAVFPAVVSSVDKVKNVCDVVYSEMEIGDVRLQAIIKEGVKGVKVYPAENSTVLVQRLGDKGEFFICMVSEIESVLMEVDTTTMEIKEGFLFKKDGDTLKDALVTFVEAVEAIIVMQGRNPDRIKLAEVKNKFQNILSNGT